MALTAVCSVAGCLAAASYLNARFLISHDIQKNGVLETWRNANEKYVAGCFRDNRMTMYHRIQRWGRDPATEKNVFLIFEGRSWTYGQFCVEVTRVGNWLMNNLSVNRGDIVPLDGTNSPEFLLMWLGLEGIGATPALINCNLADRPLAHCVKLCRGRYLLADSVVRGLVERGNPSASKELEDAGYQIVYYDRETVDNVMLDETPLPAARTDGLRPDSPSCLIFTSGTTGLPKATVMTRARDVLAGWKVSRYLGLRPGDRMYTCLPLYHGAARGLCFVASIQAGSAVILSRKFSHKTFWPEVRTHKANIIQYVGELCRYLLNAPEDPMDRQHNVSMAWGNGMRRDVWDPFRTRFDIDTINELYAATDGLFGSYNNNRGDFAKYAIGKRGLLWHITNGANEKRIRIDPLTEEIVRDGRGFAYPCRAGEPGEVVCRADPKNPGKLFAGYYGDPEATQKRILHNLFKPGDAWLRTGDMMKEDADGCLYFVDRLGDTFRWKSENVSTNEVADVLGQMEEIAQVAVYGVQVPHADGRCGCAAVVLADGVQDGRNFDWDRFAANAISVLPRYAVPVFVRIVKEFPQTGTMKIQKGKLKEGISKALLKNLENDPCCSIYWLAPGQKTYTNFSIRDWDALESGNIKL